MSRITYDSIESDVQSLVFNLIKDNLSTSANVLDGIPKTLIQNKGYPYILIHSPERKSEEMISNRIRRVNIDVNIEIWVRDKESIVRDLTGEVLNILKVNRKTMYDDRVYRYRGSSTSLNPQLRDNVRVFLMQCVISYRISEMDS